MKAFKNIVFIIIFITKIKIYKKIAVLIPQFNLNKNIIFKYENYTNSKIAILVESPWREGNLIILV